MIEKSRILYKGDILAAYFYIFIGMFLLISAIGLQNFTTTPGFYYLSLGFILFFVYCVGKGIFMVYLYGNKHKFFKKSPIVSQEIILEEMDFTKYRIDKKNINRRRYIYLIIIGSFVSFIGMFMAQKSIIMGTAIPITLIAGIEFSIGLLTEFRLREYQRVLEKANESHQGNESL